MVLQQPVHDSSIAGEKLPGWQLLPEVPLAAELMSDSPPDLPSLVETKAVPKLTYLKAQYLLHRYEATETLRRTIAQFRKDPGIVDCNAANVFTEVYVRGLALTRISPASRVIFSTTRLQAGKPGSQPDYLVPGSLVALSPRSDSFHTQCLVATVADSFQPAGTRNTALGAHHGVELVWADQADAVLDPTLELVMIESRGQYFEAIRHVMTGLQQAVAHNSRFDKYIHQASTGHQPAAYLRETPYHAAVVPENAQQLDHSQLEALKVATSQELAVVQGPPGTGKTFTSIVAIESYVRTMNMIHANRVGSSGRAAPVIIAAQTNHAVDQILERCIRLEIGSVARLGGRTQSEAIEERSLSTITRKSKVARSDGKTEATLRELRGQLRQLVQQCLPNGLLKPEDLYDRGIITQDQLVSLTQDDWETEAGEEQEEGDETQGAMSKWLDEYIQQRDYRKATQQVQAPAEAGQADFVPMDMNRPASILKALHGDNGDVWWHKASRLLARNADLYRIKPADRGALYCYLYKRSFADMATQMRQLLRQYQELCDKLKTRRRDNHIKAVQAEGIQILGCTTTGLVKYRAMLAAMQPRVLLIEEAAETREANVAAALFPSLESLVLVGDHQQLVPHADMPELCQVPHRLTVSLFQRLVNIKVPYCALRVQRRMVPAIRQVVQVFYPNLEDHDVVKDLQHRPPVPGMGGCNLWWFQHQWAQTRGDGGCSYSNYKEGAMIVGFVRYLVTSGVEPEEITVLAYYNGQVELIKSMLRHFSPGDVEIEWSVRTIDGFQGEENDIILLSLVRGPDDKGKAMPGFVADENRAVVATSRARRGFYVFGNSQNVLRGNSRSRQTWEKVIGAFGDRIGGHLMVTCVGHGRTWKVFQPEDWRNISADGCHRECLSAGVGVGVTSPTDGGETGPGKGTRANKEALLKTSDDLLDGGMRLLFARYDAASRGLDDEETKSEEDLGVLISFE